jgi:hypothetical protein
MGGWRKMHDEELHNLYSSTSIIIMLKFRKMSWGGHVARMGTEKKCIWDIGGKARRKGTTKKTRTLVAGSSSDEVIGFSK